MAQKKFCVLLSLVFHMLLCLSTSLSDLLYLPPWRKSQVLVMSENHITPLEFQFFSCFGTLLCNSLLLQSFFFLCFERRLNSVKDGPPWSLLAVNQRSLDWSHARIGISTIVWSSYLQSFPSLQATVSSFYCYWILFSALANLAFANSTRVLTLVMQISVAEKATWW